MSCGNQPAHISVIIVAAFPSVDGTAVRQNQRQKRIKEKNKVKGIAITPNLTCHSISAGGPSEASDHRKRCATRLRPRQGSRSKCTAVQTSLLDPCQGR